MRSWSHRLLKASTPGRARPEPLRPADRCLPGRCWASRPTTLDAQAAVESFEYLGEVPVHVLPLGADARRTTWTAPANRRPLAETELELAAPPMTVWDELTSPARRPGWEGELRLEEHDAGGRRGVGSMTSCVANRLSTVEEILEWRPFDGFVRRAALEGIGRLTVEHRLAPSPDGARTQLSVRWFGPKAAQALAADQAERLTVLAKHLEVAHANR